MRRILSAVFGLMFAVNANAALIPIKYTDYPHTNVFGLFDLFLFSKTNVAQPTNYSIIGYEVINQLSNAIPITSTNYYTTNITINTNTTGGESIWTETNGFAFLIRGDTNSLKVMTNGLQGIFLGDTNVAASYFGWPANGLTYLSVLPGTNRWIHATMDRSNTNGSYMSIQSQSGVNPLLSEAFVNLTNGVISSELDLVLQRTGGYLLLGGNVNDGFVGIQSGGQLSVPIGGNLIRAKWGGTDRFFLSTNGGVSFFGSATNYGRLYAQSNFFLQNPALTTNRILYLGAVGEVVTTAFAPGDMTPLWTNQSDLSILRPIAGSTNFIGGGRLNTISSNNMYATISGGTGNSILTNSSGATVAGGSNNIIKASAPYAGIAAGSGNVAGSDVGLGNDPASWAFIGGGQRNTNEAGNSVIAGGIANRIYGSTAPFFWYNSIGGGVQNVIGSDPNLGASYATIGGGNQNVIERISNGSTISGGSLNRIEQSATFATIIGGGGNTIKSNATYGVAIGSGLTVSNASNIKLGFSNTNNVIINETNLILVGNMQLLMTNDAANGKVLTSDANGVLSLQSVGGGSGGGGGPSSSWIASSNGFGTNASLHGSLTLVPFDSANSGLIAEGDSLMSGEPKVLWRLTNSYSLWRRFGMISNYAVSGSVIADLDNRWATNVAPAIATMKTAGLTNIVLMFDIGANDLGADPGTFSSAWSNYIVRAQSSNVTVITFTVLPQTNAAASSISNRFLANHYMRSSLLPDYLIDWAKLLPTPSDLNWFIDGVHLTTNGYYRAAQAVNAAVVGPKHRPEEATDAFYYSTNGYVGVAKPVPLYPLDVSGTMRADTLLATDLARADRAANTAFYAPNGGIFAAGVVSNYFAGPVGIQTLAPAYMLDVQGTVGALGGITGSSFILSTRADNLAFWAPNGGITSGGLVNNSFAGNVGIGTNAPAAKLHVTAGNASDLILQAGTTNKPSLLTLSTNGFLALMSGTIYQSNSLALPTAAQIGNGNAWVGMSNGFLVSLKSNGSVNSMLVIH